MNPAHLHLLFNHLPIIIPIVGFLVLLIGFIFKNEIVKQTAAFIFIVAALCAMPAAFTGDGAEDAIRHLPGVSKHLIHQHEEIADTFSVLCYVLGALSLISLIGSWKQKSFVRILYYVLLMVCMVVLYFGQQTGLSGGEIRHPEIRTHDSIPIQRSDD
jgi:uncharacterized membrane protein